MPVVYRASARTAPFAARSCNRSARRGTCCPTKAVATAVDESVGILKQAAQSPKGDKREIFRALRALQAAKLPTEKYPPTVGCGEYWRLVFTADSKQIQKHMKDESAGTGIYFPLTAAQKFNLGEDGVEGDLVNTVCIPHIFHLQFKGPFKFKGRKMEFDYTAVSVKLGPLVLGPFDSSGERKKQPFFLFFYADDDIICAQGASGGIAFWAKSTASFTLEKGIDF